MATVLLVEDDVALRGLYRTALGFAGFRVLEAGDGLSALRVIDRETPHIVVLDLGLPLVDGHVVRAELRAQMVTRDIPVVVITGQPGAHESLKTDCLLRKPVLTEDLVRTVRRCLADAGPCGP